MEWSHHKLNLLTDSVHLQLVMTFKRGSTRYTKWMQVSPHTEPVPSRLRVTTGNTTLVFPHRNKGTLFGRTHSWRGNCLFHIHD